MNMPKLDKLIMDQGNSWGANWNSMEGCGHDTDEDVVDKEIDGIQVTQNIMSLMDAPHPKPDEDNQALIKYFGQRLIHRRIQ